ncbi:hypothetical protein [Paraburkholderia youngii]|uniref:hypothetical protein n=1 Tax=Paraburkholderia youngii TaxID=2782701 RepID=UPI003D1A492E
MIDAQAIDNDEFFADAYISGRLDEHPGAILNSLAVRRARMIQPARARTLQEATRAEIERRVHRRGEMLSKQPMLQSRQKMSAAPKVAKPLHRPRRLGETPKQPAEA